ncbi:MAG: hypothetical protein HY606_10345, partial [Planctomycetes bacterium]|nr:hypothetical protein [Planctomycetota bacterium]
MKKFVICLGFVFVAFLLQAFTVRAQPTPADILGQAIKHFSDPQDFRVISGLYIRNINNDNLIDVIVHKDNITEVKYGFGDMNTNFEADFSHNVNPTNDVGYTTMADANGDGKDD